MLIALGAGILAGWLALLMALVLIRPKGAAAGGGGAAAAGPAAPAAPLAAEEKLPRGGRARLALLLAYLPLPVDLIRDFLPVIATPTTRSSSRSCCAAWCGGPDRGRTRALAGHRERLGRPWPA